MRFIIISTFVLAITFSYSCKMNESPIKEIPLDDQKYVLPYPVGKSYYVSLTTGHTGVRKYAVDFVMPIGSVITAAREGQVFYIRENFNDNDTGTDENLIIVKHDDNTYSRYVHLTHNGVLVEAGEWVAVDDTLGLSGSSGTINPHLHFDVTEDCYDANCQTIPIYFKGINEKHGLIKSGKYYLRK